MEDQRADEAVREAPGRRCPVLLSFPAAILALVGFFIAYVCRSRLAEPDIWWHLKNAEQLFSKQGIARVDQYSFTAAGAPWIDHEWLSEVAYYLAFRLMGLRGLMVLYTLLCLAISFLLYYLCLRAHANPKTSSILLILGIMLASVSYGPRMLLFGWLCLLVEFILLERFMAGEKVWLWLLGPLFALWVNLHGSWVFGLVVFGGFLAGGALEVDRGLIESHRLSWRQWKQAFTAAALAVAGLFVNPFGYRLVFYPFDLMFKQQINMENIEEWSSVNFHDGRGKMVLVFLLLILATALISKKRWKFYEVLLGAFALYSGLTYARMQFFMAIVFVPILASRVELFPPYDEDKEKPILNGIIIAVVLLVLVARFPSEAKLKAELSTSYPDAALAAMKSQGIHDRVFNEYLWGGYMIWAAPEIKTFIDGRADLFVYNGTFADYIHISVVEQPFELLDKYQIKGALLAASGRPAYLLSHSPCWHEAYRDKLAVVFTRVESAQGACQLLPRAGEK